MSEKINLDYDPLYEDSLEPKYQSPKATGFDLHAYIIPKENGERESIIVLPGESSIVGTGIALYFPDGYGLQVRPRSGLAAKVKVTVLNTPGTIDEDYIDELKVIIINHGKKDFTINHEDRIAQGVVEKVIQANFRKKKLSEDEIKKDRGGGLGSTGINGKVIKYG